MPPSSTHASLLSRVRDPDDAAAWREFDDCYGELILGYARALGLQAFDAEDVRQMVLIQLSRSLRNFRYEPAMGRFRDYLRRTVRNGVYRFHERHAPRVASLPIEADAAETSDGTDDSWEREWMQHHYRLALRTVRVGLDAKTVAVFERLMAGKSTDEVARHFEMTDEAVRKVRARLRRRLEELVQEQIRLEEFPEASAP